VKTVVLEVEATRGVLLAHELFGSSKTGSTISLPGDAVLELQDVIERRSLDVPSLVTLALTIPTGIASSLLANWIYDKFKGRAKTLRIDRAEVTFDEGEIEKILVERIESEE